MGQRLWPAAAPRPPRRGRPRLIGIQNSKRVKITNLNLHNQAVWCLFILYSEDVLADNLKITAEHNIPSSDGIDIDSSKRVHVNNVYIDVRRRPRGGRLWRGLRGGPKRLSAGGHPPRRRPPD